MKKQYTYQLVTSFLGLIFILGAFSNGFSQGNPDLFYYMADGNNDLYSWNRISFTIDNKGDAGVGDIEAVSFWPLPTNRKLFGTNAGIFGTIDTTDGDFTAIGEVDGGGFANGELGLKTLNDVDGLAFDGQTGKLWASERKGTAGEYDYIFQIDTATGRYVPNAFGFGVDYLLVDGAGLFEDVDDIAFNPISGLIYANSNIGGTNDLLIQVNKFTGEVDAVTSLSEDDVEGLSFHNGGQMYGSEGDDSRISKIDENTGVMTIQSSVTGGDIEGLAALVADASLLKGRVFEDVNLNGVDNSESGMSGITIDLFLDKDSNGTVGPNDQLIQSAVTAANGSYSFYFATIGYLVAKVRESTVPISYANTTDLIETAIFLDTVTFGEVDSLNDFGLATGPDCDGDGIPNFYETGVDTDSDSVADSCDLDSDDDGILDALTRLIDTDGDGLPNYKDLDSDNDGIPDAIEANGGVAPTSYNSSTGRIGGSDTDGDGLKNSVDAAPGVAYGSGSVTTLPIPDTDRDGFEDQIDLDTDNDGILDIVEGGGTDTDGDGRVDGFTDSNTDGYDDATTSSPYTIVNSDATYETTNSMELKPNYRDSDSDNDGIDDTREGQTTAGYKTPILTLDFDFDGIVDFWDVSVGGNSIDPYDRDADGTPDYFDLDTDNDGVIDFIEGNDADMNGVADVALSNTDSDSNGIDDSFDGGCIANIAAIAATSHAEQQGSSVDIGSSDLELTREDAEQEVGIYWPNFYVGQGDPVSSAYVQFETDESGHTGTVNLTIRAELSTNPSTFASTANNVTSRTTTTASVSWSITNTWGTVGETGADQRTPDISSILQEVVNQAGWVSGNPVVLIIERSDGGSTRRVAENDPVLYYSGVDSIAAAHGCESNVAVQNSDSDSERDWRDTDDDADGILTIDEDINGNDDWSDDFTQGGGTSPDYLTFSPCPGGTQPNIDTFGFASITSNAGITNPNNALGLADDAYSEFYDANDSIIVQLPVTIQAGQEYTIFYKHRNYSTGLPGGATVRLRESPDNVTYTNQPTQPSSFSLIVTDSATLTAQVNTRFITIYNPGTNPDFDFDAIRYIRTQCQGDYDGDGIFDNIDIDDDNDLVPDSIENTSSLDPTGDHDNDGIFNYEDADYCTINANGVCDSLDFDGDGQINQFDIDADNDGILDIQESGIAYSTLATVDSDSNGILDDAFSVGTNGLGNTIETSNDNGILSYTVANSDIDGQIDVLDLDSDNDGIFDLLENMNGTDTNANGIIDGNTDSDNDGMLDSGDSDVANEGSPGTWPLDSDGDGIPNYLDIDSDDDGIRDFNENPDGTGVDANDDGIVDGSTDSDNDGILDSADSDDSNEGSPNGDPTDTDDDGLIDALDLDADNDGIPDLVEAGGVDTDGDGRIDNQTDTDGDGLQNQYDTDNGGDDISVYDTDNDGVSDHLDLDADNDGIPDVVESGGTDTDGDGIADNYADTDSDGFNDRVDGDVGNDGTAENSGDAQQVTGADTDSDGIPNSYPNDDTDSDGIRDQLDLDADNDGIPDVVESGGTDTDGDGIADNYADSDSDGFNDRVDGDVGNDGTAENTADAQQITGADTDNDGAPNSVVSDDFDGDGYPSQLDLDSDGDGITDVLEVSGTDANSDGRIDNFATDTDSDGFGDSVDGDVGNDGTAENSGNALVLTGADTDNDGAPNSYPNKDSDSDGLTDQIDIDADNDGITDNAEAQATATYIAPSGNDTDGDGLDNSYDPDNSGTYIIPIDTDSDGTDDYLDDDSDDDGEDDTIEGHDSNGDGTADAGSPANTGLPGGTTDADGDGLYDGWDNNTSSRDATNGTLTPTSHPDFDAGGSERDWREVPCAGGLATLSALNTTTVANTYCTEGGWTYYYDPSDSTEILFGIEHRPAGGNTNDFTASVSLTVSVDPDTENGVFSAEDAGNEEATFVMGRYWNVSITSGSLNGDVNVRFFFDTNDADTLEAVAERWNDANAGSTSFVSGRRWFNMNAGTFDDATADLQPDGITASSELFPSTTSTLDGTTYVQFDGLSALTGGGMAYSIGTNSVILPVELLSFNATSAGKEVICDWSTAAEINSDYFDVERSANKTKWEHVGTVRAAGQSNVVLNYSLVDSEPLSGTSYYRLRQVDQDEKFELSDVRTIVRGFGSDLITVFPNPSDGILNISAPSSWSGTIALYNTMGQPVYRSRVQLSDDRQLVLDGIASGAYFVKATTDSTGEVTVISVIVR